MENLWKLEITENHVYYVDLFASIPVCEKFDNSIKRAKSAIRYKNNVLSTKDREHGDELYDDGNYTDAIIKYTSSLCFAEIGTENVALAYAKRAACFYQHALYMEALADVQLAENARVFDQLLPDFEEFRENCFTLMDSVQQRPMLIPKLSYPSHQHFPGLANILDVNINPQFGRHLIANSDIPQGKVIVAEEVFVGSHLHDLRVCCTCFFAVKNSIPCERCVSVVFCSVECMNRNQTHAFECGTLFGIFRDCDVDIDPLEGLKIKLLVQSVLNAVSIFRNVEQLMEFVENTLREHPDQISTSMHDAVSKYHFFFKTKKIVVPNNYAKQAYTLVMELPKMRVLFDTEEKQRFLMHLVTHHTNIAFANSSFNNNSAVVSNLLSLFNHSCELNAKFKCLQNIMIVVTTRPVKKGEQLFVSYLSAENLQKPLRFRQHVFEDIWGFSCRCCKCESEG